MLEVNIIPLRVSRMSLGSRSLRLRLPSRAAQLDGVCSGLVRIVPLISGSVLVSRTDNEGWT